VPHLPLSLTADDGYRLAATHYPAETPGRDRWIVIAGATGVPRAFYRRFAEFAMTQGWHVITTDYRGIGESRYGPLKGFNMEYADWSKRDLAASVDWATARGPSVIVGHSLGGHAIGQLPHPNRILAAYICGGGAGWHGWMPVPERWRVWLLWNAFGPLLTRALGYMPMRWLAAGEDLPMGVYRDWRRWCSYPNYFFDDASAAAVTQPFASVTLPIAAAAATDDWWALPASRDAFFRHYTGSPWEAIDLRPSDLEVPTIGHMGYFRPGVGVKLWPLILKWLTAKIE
jgi:predicted alpha/beta hydrolase